MFVEGNIAKLGQPYFRDYIFNRIPEQNYERERNCDSING